MVRRLWLFLGLFLLACSSAEAQLRVFASNHYRIHTDLEPGLAQDLAKRLDAMYEEYGRRLIRFAPAMPDEPVDAYLFTRQEPYLQIAGEKMRSTGGVFIASRNALAAFHDGQGRDNLRRTLQHEAFHQFAANSIRHPLPMWLNEGLAQFFEEGLWTGTGFTLGHVPPRRVRQLQADLKARRVLDFESFMSLTPEQWSSALANRSMSVGATRYTQAWAMVQFLVTAPDDDGAPRYRDRLLRLMELIQQGVDPQQAFVKSFSPNYAGFRQRFEEWAMALEPTLEATYIERQEVLADMTVAMHGYGRAFRTVEQLRGEVARAQLKIEYAKGQVRWNSGEDPMVYFQRIDGSFFSSDELYFEPRRTAPLPDIVCKAIPGSVLRTRFYRSIGKIEHERIIEPDQRAAR